MNDNSELDVSVQAPTETPQVSTETLAIPTPTRESRLRDRFFGIFSRNKSDSHQAITELANVEIEEQNLQSPGTETSTVADIKSSDLGSENESAGHTEREVGDNAEKDQTEESHVENDIDPKMTMDDSAAQAEDDTKSSEKDFYKEQEQWFHGIEPKLKLEEVVVSIDRLNNDSGQNTQYFEEQIDQNLNWFSAELERLSQAEQHILTQERILTIAANMPQLTPTERDTIGSQMEIFSNLRKRFEQKGIVLRQGEKGDMQLPLDKDLSSDDVVSVEDGNPFKYAYHGTPLINTLSIAETGLQPSGKFSKEPGTIYFSPYNTAEKYLGKMSTLFRTPITNITEARGLEEYNNGAPIVERSPIPPESLEYSFDRGKTWRKDMGVFREKPNADSGVASSPE